GSPRLAVLLVGPVHHRPGGGPAERRPGRAAPARSRVGDASGALRPGPLRTPATARRRPAAVGRGPGAAVPAGGGPARGSLYRAAGLEGGCHGPPALAAAATPPGRDRGR